jgi:hypothetical protein
LAAVLALIGTGLYARFKLMDPLAGMAPGAGVQQEMSEKNCNLDSTPGLCSYDRSIPRIQNLAQAFIKRKEIGTSYSGK